MQKKIRVLIVDDHQLMIDGIKNLLKNDRNISVVAEALNGQQALEIIKNTEINLVITDIEMPIMDGIKLTENIKEHYPDIKVLVVTMYNNVSIINKILEIKAQGYILKNTGKNELISAIQKISGGSTFYSKEIVNILVENCNKKEAIKKIEMEKNIFTTQQKKIITFICEDKKTKDIANILKISPLTVEVHRKNILHKAQVKTIVGLIKFVIKNKFYDFS